jgi:DNA-directed RNA polymerase specialized sigma24 family protein
MADKNRADTAFSFVQQYEPLLLKQARMWLSLCPIPGVEPEDVAQEVLLRAYRDLLEKGTDVEYPRSWLLRIERNVVSDLRKAERRKPTPGSLKEFDPPTIDPDPTYDWDDPVDWIDPMHWLGRALAGLKLKKKYADVLRAGLLLGTWEWADIAEHLGKAAGGVRTAIYEMRTLALDNLGWGEVIRTMEAYASGDNADRSFYVPLVTGVERVAVSHPDAHGLYWFGMALDTGFKERLAYLVDGKEMPSGENATTLDYMGWEFCGLYTYMVARYEREEPASWFRAARALHQEALRRIPMNPFFAKPHVRRMQARLNDIEARLTSERTPPPPQRTENVSAGREPLTG